MSQALLVPTTASARQYMGGRSKQQVVFGVYAFGSGNRSGDEYHPDAVIPNKL